MPKVQGVSRRGKSAAKDAAEQLSKMRTENRPFKGEFNKNSRWKPEWHKLRVKGKGESRERNFLKEFEQKISRETNCMVTWG